MSTSHQGHDLSALQGIKTAIYNDERSRIDEYLQQYQYTAIELRQFAEIADMLYRPEIAEHFRDKANQREH